MILNKYIKLSHIFVVIHSTTGSLMSWVGTVKPGSSGLLLDENEFHVASGKNWGKSVMKNVDIIYKIYNEMCGGSAVAVPGV